ncbi:hypothetical protein Kpol_1004p42 [Vanderwaltozyma polyspora DSM 70294]|uniref:YMC020W-like alpha/beta hydrolase domain-containing protein n=1 Tax=Vanderwaltozyma polyspora (strain ATCC 22028 / DSM 70294 / BCRC 21397 / CBS 2163 / NBRC 10782 / NRRL Y-8283 / UCD 57-17) TaxID=436907 RepID=A7TJ98_VANPO|nr:uncharacterized protein Kpol_1004p42 [Vanderwaltozyma polyspora DSM 70294]EDO17667.1 hypothetical protein Kpol_1004p42 [Vanderwaltozyma polyspora DSM 70294]
MASLKSNDKLSVGSIQRVLSSTSNSSNGVVRPESNGSTNSTDKHSFKKSNTRTWSLWGSSEVATSTIPVDNNDNSQKTNSDVTATLVKDNVQSTTEKDDTSTGTNNSNTTTSKKSSSVPSSPSLQVTTQDTRSRGWSFLSRGSNSNQNTTVNSKKVLPITNLVKPLSNTIIYDDQLDNSSELQRNNTPISDTETKSLDESLINPNIVVPSFDVLPKVTTWSTVSTSISKIATNLNLIAKRPREKFLYNQGPHKKLFELSNKGTKPIKVLIIGVHGFFPTRMIRPFIGEPTGTSAKFITEAEKIVRSYFSKYNTPIEINKIALEREGKVLERVNFFYDTLENNINEINSADFIYFVAHSQGCPVTIILLGRLIDTGIIRPNTSYFDSNDELPYSSGKKVISVLAMAGVNNGPFYGADQTLFVRAYSTIESDSLKELFEFQKFDSTLSRMYIQNLKTIIRRNVKITFVGSINDQLVPLYSSICLFAHHPNIFRATFIDRDSRTPKFITRIVDIAGKLIDLGHDDHGIIKEISSSLAGPLTGGGHSTVYNEAQVYELGIKFALETSDIPEETPVGYRPYKLSQLGNNPYNLPWCMRGLIYETNKYLDRGEIDLLIKEFEEWEPNTKVLKDVKYRLNGLKSKL